MPKMSSKTLIGFGFVAVGWVAERMEWPPVTLVGALLLAVGCFSAGLWKFAGEFQPTPRNQRSGKVRTLRVVLVGLLLVAAAAMGGWYYREQLVEPTVSSRPVFDLKTYRPTQVYGEVFRNTEVPLDGVSYSHCEFYNVTFRYDGVTPIVFTDNKVYGWGFKSRDDGLSNGIAFLRDMNVLAAQLVERPSVTP
jgi:hypothetical protein